MLHSSRTVWLAGEADFDGFRRAARSLLAEGVRPDAVEFCVAASNRQVAEESGSLFGLAGLASDATSDATSEQAADAAADAATCQPTLLPTTEAIPEPIIEPVTEPTTEPNPQPTPSPLRIGSALLQQLQHAALHAEPQRHLLLYRLLWRIAQGQCAAGDLLDADRVRIAILAQAVRRDLHKMKAFVRFREVAQPGHADPLHVAWFEPEHHIVEAVAPFFVRRFAGMRFAILTPRRSMHWDGHDLRLVPGAARADAPPADAGEALWLTYYAHIFNPARLKLQAMENEMPRKYWKNLPEAVLISPLAAAATTRAGSMVAAQALPPRRRIPAAARAPDAQAAQPQALQWLPPAPGASAAERQALLLQRRQAADQCRACPIGQHATQTVHGEGPIDARWMVVGEQPGDAEDLSGRPLVGPSGQLFDQALAVLGWPRATLYLSNAVRHFKYLPRGKRRLHKTPAQQEAAACLHWLEEEIALVRPALLIALGATAARALLGHEVAVLQARGHWFVHAASGTPVLVTLHPSALLRMPEPARAQAYAQWLDDLRLARDGPPGLA